GRVHVVRRLMAASGFGAMLLIRDASAHGTAGLGRAGSLEVITAAGLVIVGVLYGMAYCRLRSERQARAIPLPATLGFAAGVLLAAAALIGLESLAAHSLAVHMAQHMLLLAVVPPLLVEGRAGRIGAVLPAI